MCPQLVNLGKFYSKLKEFRETERYVDVSIECGNRIFRCHRLALTIASNYFDVMFNGNFRESTTTNVILQEIDGDTFEQVLNFIYTGDVIINSTNVCNLLRASDFFGLSSVEEQCVKYIESRQPLTVENILDIFTFTCTTEKNELKKIVSIYIAEHFSVIYRTDLFLQITFEDLINIVDRYSSMSAKNEDILLQATIRWVHHKHSERSQYLDKFWKLIRLENISPQFTKLMVEEMMESNPVRAQTQQIIKSIDYAEIAELQATLMPEIFLYLYVWKDNNSYVNKILSINNDHKCTVSSGMVSTTRTAGVADGFRNFSKPDNNYSYLYCLNFCQSYSNGSSYNQTFSAFTSIDRCSTLALTPPPVVFESSPDMCHVSNNIYVLRRYWSAAHRTNSPSSKLFNDDEIGRNIYAYNCELDKWFSIPRAKEITFDSHMAAYDNVLYLLGGTTNATSVQAYDVRTEIWRVLPKRTGYYGGGLSYGEGCGGCCTLDGKIYIVNPRTTERYDPIAGKWENIYSPTVDDSRLVTSYSDRVWNVPKIRIDDNFLTLDIYDPSLNEWSKLNMDIRKTMGIQDDYNSYNVYNVTDLVVFK